GHVVVGASAIGKSCRIAGETAETFSVFRLRRGDLHIEAQKLRARTAAIAAAQSLTRILEEQTHEIGARRRRYRNVEDKRQRLGNGRILVEFWDLRFFFRLLRVQRSFDGVSIISSLTSGLAKRDT